MFILMMVTILSYGIVDTAITYSLDISLVIWQRILVHLICLPLVAGLGYEVLKFFAKHQNNWLFKTFLNFMRSISNIKSKSKKGLKIMSPDFPPFK